ncbi:fimbrial protein [Salmonella enterica subsp. diarizonae]|nr:long polar fimbrial protein LpfA [Salmonella enterica subsp. diarizonae]ECJ5865523.1 long polar fimbrial protein LpfA [Salmonella enterica subsp. diarizonae]EEB6126844.1 fimbrial protein [Salmonella enterica subsp. diarizonae]
MRNKIILAMAAAGMMCATSAFAADAGGGTIAFSGSVIEAPCNIDKSDLSVDLGQVSTKSLKNASDASDLKSVTITLIGCSFDKAATPVPEDGTTGNYSKVAVTFPDAPPPATADGELKNGEIRNMVTAGAAKNVAIQLLYGDGVTPVDLTVAPTAKDPHNITLDTDATTNQLNFFARMISVAGGATTGKVGAQITYKLKYF